MQINSIQTSQPNFGTRLKMDFSTLDAMTYLSGSKKQFMKAVKQLENNGHNDVFVVNRSIKDNMLNAYIYEVKPAKSKNGYDLYRDSDIIEFEYLTGNHKENTSKKIMARMLDAYNTCYETSLNHVFWPKRTNAEWTKYLI